MATAYEAMMPRMDRSSFSNMPRWAKCREGPRSADTGDRWVSLRGTGFPLRGRWWGGYQPRRGSHRRFSVNPSPGEYTAGQSLD